MTPKEWAENWDLLNDADRRSLTRDFCSAMSEARKDVLKEAIEAVGGIILTAEYSEWNNGVVAGIEVALKSLRKLKEKEEK